MSAGHIPRGFIALFLVYIFKHWISLLFWLQEGWRGSVGGLRALGRWTGINNGQDHSGGVKERNLHHTFCSFCLAPYFPAAQSESYADSSLKSLWWCAFTVIASKNSNCKLDRKYDATKVSRACVGRHIKAAGSHIAERDLWQHFHALKRYITESSGAAFGHFEPAHTRGVAEHPGLDRCISLVPDPGGALSPGSNNPQRDCYYQSLALPRRNLNLGTLLCFHRNILRRISAWLPPSHGQTGFREAVKTGEAPRWASWRC